MTLLLNKKWLIPLAICAVGGAGLQFVRPTLENPPVTGDISAPAPVKEILQRACYDCHSNETHLAWFDRISPAIWLVAKHVKDGRAVLNFSQWERLPKDQQKGKLFESLNQATFNEMPPAQYTMLHPSAKLTARDIAVLKDYLATQMVKPAPDAAKTGNGQNQYAAWTHAAAATNTVQPTPNGIAFMPEYKNWAAVSSTDRLDNGTMRVIMGNEVAVKAIHEQKTSPWPDGSTFAKVAWDEAAEADGSVHPGEFKQVEFMTKDSQKYAATDGWGFARWKGIELQPYGKDASFTTECVNCHAPMRDSDFVFTNPIGFGVRQP